MTRRIAQLGLLLSMAVGCGRSGNFAPGQALFTWEIRNAMTNAPVGCVPNEEVVVDFGNGLAFSFPCASLSGITPGVAPMNYAVHANLTLPGGTVESATDFAIPVTVLPNGTTQVDPVLFLVNRQ